MGRREVRELVAEDDVDGAARAAQQHDVAHVAPCREVAQDAHHRRDAAAAGDEQQLGRRLAFEREVAGRVAEVHDRAVADVLVQEARDDAVVHALDGDRDQPLAGRRGNRVAATHSLAGDLDVDRYVLSGGVSRPGRAGAQHERLHVAGFVADGDDASALSVERPAA